ncbi:hypothetical protein J53TS2_29880 [Paenibacillus sp. J53TS2]|uniref:DUF4177 domain-containing protein n=1 Tax=Paenibacillus sp. J53TS2 TaxID=2807197 RepID=UPI001AFF23C2|nr:DUF4177 domain-containing protein [Paenibacillus sp. J53TS2]GIP49397.1 hypothetical protein J53TS2_29880 [Paenibacillus sp. J53TS2]
MNKWEYKTIKVKPGGFMGGKVDETEFERELNQFGQYGWEVVSCFDTSYGQGTSREVIVVFKRPVVD